MNATILSVPLILGLIVMVAKSETVYVDHPVLYSRWRMGMYPLLSHTKIYV